METTHILITGSTGKTGKRVAARLARQPHVTLRLGSRAGVPPFDWETPSTWPAALEGIDKVYLTFQPDLAVPTAADTIRQFVALSRELGVQHIVLLSGRGEPEAEVCEQIVQAGAKHWTIVRASWFHQNFSEGFFLDPLLAGHVALPQPETLEPFVDADDIADVVVETLLHDRHYGQVYSLTGPRLLTFPQVVEEIARATGRSIAFQPLTLEEYVAMLREYQVPEEVIWLAHYLFAEILDGRNASLTHDVEKVLGRAPKDLCEYVRETAATGIWNPNVQS